MTVDESLERFGLQPSGTELEQVRALLVAETSKESASQGDGDTELMRLCCVQLFGAGRLADVELIWAAKSASMDANASIDVQLLCGAGLEATLTYLRSGTASWMQKALRYLEDCIAAGDFEGFDVGDQWSQYSEYYEAEE